jgi:hypothetical protein
MIRSAIIGIVLFEAIAIIWALVAPSWWVALGAVALGIVGAAGGVLVAWMTEPNRGDRWWAEHRRRPPGATHTVPAPDALVEQAREQERESPERP